MKSNRKTNEGISGYDNFISHGKFLLKNRLIALFVYRKLYDNYLSMIVNVLKNRYPLEAVLRKNNEHVILHDHTQLMGLTNFLAIIDRYHERIEYSIKDDRITLLSFPYETFGRTTVTMNGGIMSSEAATVLLNNVYGDLPVKGRTVIDIGANVGDSSIYFALRGACNVIALEPIPQNHDLAKLNIEMNSFLDRILLLQAGCAATDGSVTVSHSSNPWVGSRIQSSSEGRIIPLLTLERIVKDYNIPQGSILKMDCEGCENNAILSANKNILRLFSHIQIEYHYGYKHLRQKLEHCGFQVLITKPTLMPDPYDKTRKLYIGNILAKSPLG